jgi:rubrerythrin
MAAGKGLAFQVRDVVENALANEREAVARYDAFAAKATEEGYLGVASLFRAQAQAERAHAKRFAAILTEHGAAVPPETPLTPNVSSTIDNLHTAVSAETSENDGIYRKSIETCNQLGATDIAKIFDQTRDSEIEHANLCKTAARNIESMKEPKSFYVCGKCGYTTDVKLPYCPACQHKHAPVAVQ